MSKEQVFCADCAHLRRFEPLGWWDCGHPDAVCDVVTGSRPTCESQRLEGAPCGVSAIRFQRKPPMAVAPQRQWRTRQVVLAVIGAVLLFAGLAGLVMAWP